MVTKKSVWVLLSVIIAAWLLGSVTQVMAETVNGKFINRVTKMESLPIPDARKFITRVTKMESLPIPDSEGDSVKMTVIEGAAIPEDGELAWQKAIIIVNPNGSFSQYATNTYQDGSTITSLIKGPSSSGLPAKQDLEIIYGTGRFQGIKGTITSTLKFFPPEGGEIGWRTVGEITMTYTLPPK